MKKRDEMISKLSKIKKIRIVRDVYHESNTHTHTNPITINLSTTSMFCIYPMQFILLIHLTQPPTSFIFTEGAAAFDFIDERTMSHRK